MWSIGEKCNIFWKGGLKQLYAPQTEQEQEGAGAGADHIEPIFKLLWAGAHSDAIQLFVLGGGTPSQPRLSSITFPSVPLTSEALDPKRLRFQFYPQIDSSPIRDFVLIPPSRPENIFTLQNEVFLSSISPQSTQAMIPFSLLSPITHSHLLTIDRGSHCRLSAFISEAEAPLLSLPLGGVLRQANSAETADPRFVKVRSSLSVPAQPFNITCGNSTSGANSSSRTTTTTTCDFTTFPRISSHPHLHWIRCTRTRWQN